MVSKTYVPDRGDIVWINLNPTRGREQKGKRPAFVVSPKLYNLKTDLALFCPITSQIKNYPFEVFLNTEKIAGVILADQMKTMDWKERKVKFVLKTDLNIIKEVCKKINTLIN